MKKNYKKLIKHVKKILVKFREAIFWCHYNLFSIELHTIDWILRSKIYIHRHNVMMTNIEDFSSDLCFTILFLKYELSRSSDGVHVKI